MALEVATIGENIEFAGQSYWSGLDGTLINTVINMSATGTLVVTDADSIVSHTIEYSVEDVGDPSSFPGGNPGDYFSSAVSGINILVTYNEDIALLPMKQIQYLETIDNLITIPDWGGLPGPSESPKIKLMEENNVDHVPVTLSVTVEYLKNQTPATVSGVFTAILVANYDISADILQDELSKRETLRL